MASAPDQTTAAILGEWDVTWRPKLAPPLTGRLLLEEDGDGFAATLSGDATASGSGEIRTRSSMR